MASKRQSIVCKTYIVPVDRDIHNTRPVTEIVTTKAKIRELTKFYGTMQKKLKLLKWIEANIDTAKRMTKSE